MMSAEFARVETVVMTFGVVLFTRLVSRVVAVAVATLVTLPAAAGAVTVTVTFVIWPTLRLPRAQPTVLPTRTPPPDELT